MTKRETKVSARTSELYNYKETAMNERPENSLIVSLKELQAIEEQRIADEDATRRRRVEAERARAAQESERRTREAEALRAREEEGRRRAEQARRDDEARREAD